MILINTSMVGSRGGGDGQRFHTGKSQNYRVSLQYAPPTKRHLNGVDDGPRIVVFGSFLPSLTKKTRCKSWTPSDTTFWIRAWHRLSGAILVRSFYTHGIKTVTTRIRFHTNIIFYIHIHVLYPCLDPFPISPKHIGSVSMSWIPTNRYFGNQWIPRWNAALCGIKSETTLFAKLNKSSWQKWIII